MSEDCPRSDYTPPVSLCPGLLLRLCICNNALDISPHYDHFIHFNEGQDNTIVPDIKKGWDGNILEGKCERTEGKYVLCCLHPLHCHVS